MSNEHFIAYCDSDCAWLVHGMCALAKIAQAADAWYEIRDAIKQLDDSMVGISLDLDKIKNALNRGER